MFVDDIGKFKTQ